MSVYAAFVLILGLNGQPTTAAEAVDKFETVEACQNWNIEHAGMLTDRLTAAGVGFSSVVIKCAVDTGQTPAEVFALGAPA